MPEWEQVVAQSFLKSTTQASKDLNQVLEDPPGGMELWATWSSGWQTLPTVGDWNSKVFKVISNPTIGSMILSPPLAWGACTCPPAGCLQDAAASGGAVGLENVNGSTYSQQSWAQVCGQAPSWTGSTGTSYGFYEQAGAFSMNASTRCRENTMVLLIVAAPPSQSC